MASLLSWQHWPIAAYDRLFRWLNGLDRPGSHVGPVLRLKVRPSRRGVRLMDGTVVRRGDPIGVIHLDNERVVSLHAEGRGSEAIPSPPPRSCIMRSVASASSRRAAAPGDRRSSAPTSARCWRRSGPPGARVWTRRSDVTPGSSGCRARRFWLASAAGKARPGGSREGRVGPPPFARRHCRRNFRIARLGRVGPSPRPSCGSHCVRGEVSERGRCPRSECQRGVSRKAGSTSRAKRSICS